jgi:hypothetical protein
MAMFPCSVGDHRYPGAQQSIYLAALNGTFSARGKKRLCPQHFDDLENWIGTKLVHIGTGTEVTEEYKALTDRCYECGTADTPWQLFANVFRAKNPQRDYYSRSCTEHMNPFREIGGLEL